MAKAKDQQIIKLYEQGDSTYSIAKCFNTYPNRIRRVLVENGIKLRSRSKAQKIALANGRSNHPTEGKHRSQDTKLKISENLHTHWANLTPEEKQKRVDKSREQWYNMSEAARTSLRSMASAAVREASKHGSKIERFLRDSLRDLGYNVEFHRTGLIQNIDLEIDIYLPKLNTAIEIDGPTHFFPIWGEDKLQKHVKADADKAGLLLANGKAIIRIKHITKHISAKYKRDILTLLLNAIQKIEHKFPPKSKRYIELEL